jgi:hypothetical protein
MTLINYIEAPANLSLTRAEKIKDLTSRINSLREDALAEAISHVTLARTALGDTYHWEAKQAADALLKQLRELQ